ncbi:MAG: hypothetical protein AB7P76_02985 [Candidatus Melainabacteria bacterium]
MKINTAALAQPFTKTHLPNTMVNLVAPLASYALIPWVAGKRLERSHASQDEKRVLLAREVAGQAVNAGIQVVNFALGMVFGSRLGKGTLSKKLLGGFSQEGTILLVTAGLNFFFYTFVRPWLGITVLDHWMKKHLPLPAEAQPATASLASGASPSNAFSGPFAVFSRRQQAAAAAADATQQGVVRPRVEQFL